MAQPPPPQYILPSQSLPLIPVRPTVPNNEATSQILNRRNSEGGSVVNGCSPPTRRCSENNLSSHPTSSSNNNNNEKPNAISSTVNNNNSKYNKQSSVCSDGENIMSRSNTPPPKSLLLDSSSLTMNYSNSRVSQIVNEALDKARSGELGNDTAKCEHDTTNIRTNNNNNDNMGEINGAATNNKVAPIIVSSRTISMTKDEFTSIILNQNDQINNSKKKGGGDSETLVESSSPSINFGERNLNNLGENNNNDREIRIGNTGNPIGSLGYLWDSVATQKEMTVVVAADVSEKEGIDNSESE